MAVQLAMRHFHDLFDGRDLIVFSDHKPLVHAFKHQDPQLHDPADKIKYVPPEETLAALEEVSINILSPDSIAEAQKNCPEVQAHRDGKGPKGVVVDDVVMGNVSLLCEVSDVRNPRPVVPVGQRS